MHADADSVASRYPVTDSLRNSARPLCAKGGPNFFYIPFAVLSRLSYSTAPIRLNGQ